MANYLFLSLAQAVLFALVSYSSKGSKLRWGILSILMFLLVGIINYFGMPTLQWWGFEGVWIETFIVSVLGFVAFIFNNDEDYPEPLDYLRLIPVVITLIAPIVAFCQTTRIANAEEYANRIEVTTVDVSSFRDDIVAIDVEKMITVDQQLAQKVANDVLGDIASKVDVGNMTIQNFTGKFTINDGKVLEFENHPIWVAPLEHDSFYRWLTNKTTPGYVIVDATNSEKRYIVTKVNGEDIALKYIESAPFKYDIERHIRINGYVNRGLNDHSFEIDSNGRPYWVLSAYDQKIGFGGEEVDEVITVDAQTGEISTYSVEDAPNWIDRIQPELFITEMISDWGKLQLGWLNSSAFGKKEGVIKPTPGMTLVYSQGNCYWYTGMQPARVSSEATCGFMLVDTHTKKATYYKVEDGGFNETEAMRIANGQSAPAAAGYTATFPVLYNVRGIPTYFMTYKDSYGNIQGYCFVASNQRSAVGYDKSKNVAVKNYFAALANNKVADNILESDVSAQSITATIRDIVLVGDTYYILLNEKPGFEFTANVMSFNELKYSKVGSKVNITFFEGEETVIPIDNFDINNFDI